MTPRNPYPEDGSPEYYGNLFDKRINEIDKSPGTPSGGSDGSSVGTGLGWIFFIGAIVAARACSSIGSNSRPSYDYNTPKIEIPEIDPEIIRPQFDPEIHRPMIIDDPELRRLLEQIEQGRDIDLGKDDLFPEVKENDKDKEKGKDSPEP